jgi:hypothetical protein
MIDWLAIATAAVAILTSFLTKTAEKAGEKSGEALLKLVKDKFKKGQDEKAAQTLENFQQNPERYRSAMVDVLKEKAEADPEFGETMRDIVAGAEFRAQSDTVSQTAMGTGIAQATGTGASASVVMAPTRKPKKKR